MAERPWIIRHGCFTSTLATIAPTIALGLCEWRLSALASGKRASARQLP